MQTGGSCSDRTYRKTRTRKAPHTRQQMTLRNVEKYKTEEENSIYPPKHGKTFNPTTVKSPGIKQSQVPPHNRQIKRADTPWQPHFGAAALPKVPDRDVGSHASGARTVAASTETGRADTLGGREPVLWWPPWAASPGSSTILYTAPITQNRGVLDGRLCLSQRDEKARHTPTRDRCAHTWPILLHSSPPPPGATMLLGTAAQPHRGGQHSGSWGAGEADGPGPRHWTNVTEMSVGAWEKAVDSRAFRRDAGRDSPDI